MDARGRSASALLYTAEWQACRDAQHTSSDPGCYSRSEHYYPVLPAAFASTYAPASRRSGSRLGLREEATVVGDEGGTTTEPSAATPPRSRPARCSPATSEDSSPAPRRGPLPVPVHEEEGVLFPHCTVHEATYVGPGPAPRPCRSGAVVGWHRSPLGGPTTLATGSPAVIASDRESASRRPAAVAPRSMRYPGHAQHRDMLDLGQRLTPWCACATQDRGQMSCSFRWRRRTGTWLLAAPLTLHGSTPRLPTP